jgi:hypothetical protein
MADFDGWCGEHSNYRPSLHGDRKKYKPEDVLDSLTEEDFMICHTAVAGYSLRENKWGRFHVNAIGEIAYDTAAFDNLILPDYQKQQLLSLVRVHEDDRFFFDDIIKGKGKGMTFLLYGEPGLGKTLTAGKFHRPSESRTNNWFRKYCRLLPEASGPNRCWNTWNLTQISGGGIKEGLSACRTMACCASS